MRRMFSARFVKGAPVRPTWILAVALLTLCCAGWGIAQALSWETISGVPGCFTVTSGADGITFAASSGAQNFDGILYSSSDQGLSWYPTSITYGEILELGAYGSNIIISRNLSSGRTPYQVLLSRDNGQTFSGILSADLFSTPVSGFMYSTKDSIFGVAGGVGPSGLYSILVKRNGQRWDPVGTTFPLVSFHAFPFPSSYVPAPTAIDENGRIFVGTLSNGLYSTTNDGTTWTQTLPGLYVTAIRVISPSLIYVATSPNTTRNGGVFVSSDSGSTWTYLGLSDRSISAVAVSPSGALFASSSAGVNRYSGTPGVWDDISPDQDAFGGVAVPVDGTVLAASPALGLFRSGDNGTSWERSGISQEDVSAILVTADQTLYVGTYGDRVFRSTNSGGTWVQASGDMSCDNITSFAAAGSTLVAGTDCGVFRTLDGGLHWGHPGQGVITGSVFSLGSDAEGRMFAGTGLGMYVSNDSGSTWTLSGLNGYTVGAIAVDGSETVTAMTTTGGLFQSADHGGTWTSIGLVRNDLQTVAVNSDGVIMAGGSGGVFVSTDHGGTWTNSVFTSAFVYALLCKDASTFVAGTGGGIFATTNLGASWLPENGGLNQTVVLSLGLDQQGFVYAGTYHGGPYKSKAVLTSVDPHRALPQGTTLLQNYPNPFNPSTSLSVQVSKPGRVLLEVFNVLGERVGLLLDERKEPGMYTVSWDAGSRPSGVYVCRLTANGTVSMRKMMLIR